MSNRPTLKLYDEDGAYLGETEIRRDSDYLVIVEMTGSYPLGTKVLSLQKAIGHEARK